MNDRKRAIGYVRVSTDEQAREGVSLAAQERRIRSYAQSQGWELVKIYREEGISGKTLDRPQLQTLIADLDQVDVLLVYKVDRLTRRQKHLWYLLEDVLEPAGVGFKSVVEPFDTTTAQGKAFLGMLAVFAQLERDTTSERTRQSLAQKRETGEWCGRVPFGFRIEDGVLAEDDEALDLIQRAKKMRRQGRSIRAISEALQVPRSTISRAINAHLKSIKAKYNNAI